MRLHRLFSISLIALCALISSRSWAVYCGRWTGQYSVTPVTQTCTAPKVLKNYTVSIGAGTQSFADIVSAGDAWYEATKPAYTSFCDEADEFCWWLISASTTASATVQFRVYSQSGWTCGNGPSTGVSTSQTINHTCTNCTAAVGTVKQFATVSAFSGDVPADYTSWQGLWPQICAGDCVYLMQDDVALKFTAAGKPGLGTYKHVSNSECATATSGVSESTTGNISDGTNIVHAPTVAEKTADASKTNCGSINGDWVCMGSVPDGGCVTTPKGYSVCSVESNLAPAPPAPDGDNSGQPDRPDVLMTVGHGTNSSDGTVLGSGSSQVSVGVYLNPGTGQDNTQGSTSGSNPDGTTTQAGTPGSTSGGGGGGTGSFSGPGGDDPGSFASITAGFKTRLAASGVGQAANAFSSLPDSGGSCPTAEIPFDGETIVMDQWCGPWPEIIAPILGAVLLAGAAVIGIFILLSA